MYSFRRKIVILTVAAVALSMVAADYGLTARKAARFFDNREWASASAMYELMLNEKPSEVETYALAIVAAYENADTLKAMNLFERAQANFIPFDSVLTATRRTSFAVGEPRLYEDFLLRVRQANPSIERPINAYLLKYYLFRHDGENIMKYAEIMSVGAPNAQEYVKAFNEGLRLTGRTDEMKFIAGDSGEMPESFDELVNIGVTAMVLAEADSTGETRRFALKALTAANKIKTTPKLREYITNLSEK